MNTNKPKFDPSKPFSVVSGGKPKFDPNKPFVVVSDEPPKTSGIERGLDVLPTAGGIVGGFFGPQGAALGGGAGEAFRQLGARGAEVAGVDIRGEIPETSSRAAALIAKEGGKQAALDVGGRLIGAGIAKGARFAGTKALGMTKRFLNNQKVFKASMEAADSMVDSGVISPLGSTEKMIERVTALKDEAGKKISGFLASHGIGFQPAAAIQRLEQLRPKIPADQRMAGHFAAVNGAIDKAIETIRAYGDGPISFEQANELKGLLQSVTDFGSTEANKKIGQAIAGTFRQTIDDTLEAASNLAGKTREFAEFLSSKKLYQGASRAEEALFDKQAGEAGNKALGLTDWLATSAGAGIGGAAGGGVGAAVGASAGYVTKKIAEKYGPQTAAVLGRKITQNPSLIPGIIKALNLGVEQAIE